MRSLVSLPFLLLVTGCVGDLVELGPKGVTSGGPDMATGGGGGTGGTGGGGGGGSGGGGGTTDMAMGTTAGGPDLSKITFAADIQPDIAGTNATACMGQPCGCTNTGCHAAGNQPILGTNAGTNYTNMMASTYLNQPVINKTTPASSPLLQQLLPPPTGQHPGGQKFSGTNDPTYLKWLAWITQGAPQ